MTEDFVATSSRWRVLLMILGCAAFVFAGLWMVGAFGEIPTSRRYPPAVGVAMGLLSILLFGTLGLRWIQRFANTGDYLRIGNAGIFWEAWSDQTIPWSEISNVTCWSNPSQRFLVIHLVQPDRFPGRGLIGLLSKLNQPIVGGDLTINLAATNRSFDEAWTAIEMFRPQFGRVQNTP